MAGRTRHRGTVAAGARSPRWGCLCACALLGGCAQTPSSPPAQPAAFLGQRQSRPPLEIGVLVGGWHTGIVLPAGELGPLRMLLQTDPQDHYLAFGWGNRRFYMSAQPGPGDAIAALFRSPSALFVQPAAAPADLQASDAAIHWVCADRAQIWRVDHYIEQTLAAPGHPVDLGPGPFPDSRFYASSAHYSAVHTCNTWTAGALQYAGLPVGAGGVLFASQVGARVGKLRACPAPQ